MGAAAWIYAGSNEISSAEDWGSLNFGGAITTGGNLTFVAATLDNHFRAFNTKTV
jgi:glucose dehydrogenase